MIKDETHQNRKICLRELFCKFGTKQICLIDTKIRLYFMICKYSQIFLLREYSIPHRNIF